MEERMNDNTSRSAPSQTVTKMHLQRFSTVLKMAAIAILVLLLLIPLAMVRSVLHERLDRRNAAVREITATWGNEQVIMGPVLIVPYKYNQNSWKDQFINGRVERLEVSEAVRRRAYFLPAVFKAEGRLSPDRLHRGIYETVVYSGTLNLSGSFSKPSFEEWNVDLQQILWDEAEVAISITDLRGAKESLHISLAGQEVPLKPGRKLEGFTGGVYARIRGLSGETDAIPFALSLTLNGSRGLRFAPVGVNNDVQLSSTWPDPSFQGAFLPAERDVRPNGFTAHWQVSYYGRSYPQQWNDKTPVGAAGVSSSLFGVDLVPALDSYRYVERSIKYGILLIALLFTAFFLFEILSAVRIHPFQYTLVGIALCLFYLGLLALSEVTSFTTAYWIGAAMALLMIALYSVRALRSARRGGLVGIGLALIYAFLFVILRLQDYALLVGAAGLFLVLAIVMFVTRNIDWYARDTR
jgi:inner membrane protein